MARPYVLMTLVIMWLTGCTTTALLPKTVDETSAVALAFQPLPIDRSVTASKSPLYALHGHTPSLPRIGNEPEPTIISSDAALAMETAPIPIQAKRKTPSRLANIEPLSVSETLSYKIEVGDTLAQIANKFYGNPHAWRRIANYNHIANPHLIQVGKTLQLPQVRKEQHYAEKTTRQKASPKEKLTVTVKRGDTLSTIAERTLGSARAWRSIWQQNRNLLNNPNHLRIGQVLSFRVHL